MPFLLQESYRKNRMDLQGLVLKRYPDFVRSNRAHSLQEGIPVFVFHDVEPVRFEAQLRYLRDNGYAVLQSADDLYNTLRGERSMSPRSVLLTFDDGLESLFTVAFPLLRAYGMAAVSFIIPGFVGQPGFCAWSQIREMHDSGIVDVQSHTLFHRFAPAWPRIIPCLDAAQRCRTQAAQHPSMADDYRISRERLEEQLRKPVRHLCYPDYDGTTASVAVSQETGYLTNFWGVLPEKQVNRPGDDPFRICRLAEQYLFRLPGRGRRPLRAVLCDKWTSRRRVR